MISMRLLTLGYLVEGLSVIMTRFSVSPRQVFPVLLPDEKVVICLGYKKRGGLCIKPPLLKGHHPLRPIYKNQVKKLTHHVRKYL